MNHLGELLSVHLDGELADHERPRVAEHLQVCDRCRTELVQLAEARSLVRSLPMLELPVAVADSLGLARDPLPMRRRPAVWAGAAAAAVLVALVGSAIITAPQPQQISPTQLSAVYGAVSSNTPGLVTVKVATVTDTAVQGGAR